MNRLRWTPVCENPDPGALCGGKCQLILHASCGAMFSVFYKYHSLNPHNNLKRQGLLFSPFYKQRNWGIREAELDSNPSNFVFRLCLSIVTPHLSWTSATRMFILHSSWFRILMKYSKMSSLLSKPYSSNAGELAITTQVFLCVLGGYVKNQAIKNR